MNNIGAYNPNISISLEKAKTLYGIQDKDVKDLDFNGDDVITLQELRRFGFNKYFLLTDFFDKKVNGALSNPQKAEQKQMAYTGKKQSFSANPYIQNDQNNFIKTKLNRIA